jgi:hypothetical protein
MAGRVPGLKNPQSDPLREVNSKTNPDPRFFLETNGWVGLGGYLPTPKVPLVPENRFQSQNLQRLWFSLSFEVRRRLFETCKAVFL